MSTIVVNGKNYTIYGTRAGADDYLNGGIGAGYDDYNALVAGGVGNDNKIGRLLVAATRLLDRQRWQDAVDTFALRDAFLDPLDGRPLFQLACYELAVAILSDDSLQSNPTSGSNVSSVGAGPAQVSFFRPTLGITGRFPTIVQELVGLYMAGRESSDLGVVSSYGTDAESEFDDADAFALDRSF